MVAFGEATNKDEEDEFCDKKQASGPSETDSERVEIERVKCPLAR